MENENKDFELEAAEEAIETVTEETITDETVTDETVTEEIVTEETVTEETVTEETVTEETVAEETVAEETVESVEEEVVENTSEEEFDPTESEAFYDNLEAAISFDEPTEEELPELVLSEDTFALDEEKNQVQGSLEDELFAGVDAALTEQIEQEFGGNEEVSSTKEKKQGKLAFIWKAIPKWTKVLVSVILVILISVGLLFGTSGGRKIIYKVIVKLAFFIIPEDPDNLGYISPAPNLTPGVTPDLTIDPSLTTVPDQNLSVTPEPTGNPVNTPIPTEAVSSIMDDENIINILLLGEENMFNDGRGRTDAIILVSIDLNGGPLKMISFLRDMYVQIPGYADDKLNAAYQYGGADLVVATIEKNFKIDVDSYVKVNFSGFENIIDKLGGLRISLTAKESDYLNTTLYISKPEERNTIAGEQMMTGAQVLGYCRVRHVPTANGLYADWGRNYRHRVVLQALFEQYKEKKLPELITIAKQCFSYVSAPAELEDVAYECLTAVMENQMFTIDTLQMPQKGLLNEATISGKDVISFFPENIDILQDFLYGEE